MHSTGTAGYHAVAKKLKGSVALNVIQSHGDIKQHNETLVFKGFVSVSGLEKLDDIIRYLKGILRRLEKLPIDPNQDRLKLIEVNKAVDFLFRSFHGDFCDAVEAEMAGQNLGLLKVITLWAWA